MKHNSYLSWQIGAAFIGTVIGAGFATGQEIMFFFTRHGIMGLFTLFLSGIIFICSGCAVFYTSHYQRSYNYNDYLHKLCHKNLAAVYDIIISMFLFSGTSIMFSGSGALFYENFNIPHIIGVSVIAFLTLLVVLRSVKGILSMNSIVVPVLICVISVIFILNLNTSSMQDFVRNVIAIKTDSFFKSIFSFVFYCSYNMVLSIGVLSAFTQDIQDLKTLYKGALIGGSGLLILSLALNYCLIINAPAVFKLSIPILYIIKDYQSYIKLAVIICVWCAVFSTAVSNVFSLCSRLTKNSKSKHALYTLLITLICIPVSFVDFRKLVSFFYPLFGALSMFLIFQIQIMYFRLSIKNRHYK